MKKLCCLALGLLLLCGCQTSREATKTVFAMDTVMTVTACGADANRAVSLAADEVNRLDALLSAQREDSDIAVINRQDGDVMERSISEEVVGLLKRTQELCEATGGALDVTIYPAMELWGFYSGDYRVPSPEELDALTVDFTRIQPGRGVVRPNGTKLDLGAVGKGYAADQIVHLWRDMGIASGILNLGGNVQCLGSKPDGGDWRVAIRDPADGNLSLATVTGRDMAVVTSGAYQRNFEVDGVTYHHILEPETCYPADSGLSSVTIVASSGFLADGLSTAVYVMGLDAAAALWRERRDFDMILYTDQGELFATAGLEGRVTPAEGLSLQVLDG